MSDPRFAGHCFVCGGPTFEVIRKHVDGPMKGEPSQLGKPLKDATRCELILISGRRMPVTVHEKCVEMLGDDLPKHWKTIMRAFKHEEDTRALRKVSPRTPAQQKAHDDFMTDLVNDVPLGVLNAENLPGMAR